MYNTVKEEIVHCILTGVGRLKILDMVNAGIYVT